MEAHLKVIGIILIVLGIIHAFFPKYFNWKEELASLNLVNRQMMEVHTFFVGLTVFLMGLLCLTATRELMESALGKTITLGLAVFWGIRFVFQLFVYSPTLWKGKRFETLIHILFILLWAYLSGIFFWVACSG